jgi:hypothetical protein
MYGYVYLTENLINGKKYIGQHKASNVNDDKYLGSGINLKRAIKKYGAQNFKREILAVADTRQELNVLEISLIAEYGAVTNKLFYNIAAGGDGGDTFAGLNAEQLANYAAKVRLRWSQMTPENRARVSENMRQRMLGRPKSAEHCRNLSAAKMGKNNWSPESIARMVEKRKAQIAQGIGVPPTGNRGNHDFRHDEAARLKISRAVRQARARVALERGDYLSEETRAGMREKVIARYTPETREEHSKLVRAGHARRLAEFEASGVAPPKFHWYHNPSDPKQRATFSSVEEVPDGWVSGMGKGRAGKVDRARVIALIEAGRKNADIAREVGCAASRIWEIRNDLGKTPPA